MREPRAISSSRRLWSGASRASAYFATVAVCNAALLALAIALDAPTTATFLLNVLPAASVALFVMAAATIPAIVAARARVGIAAALALAAALAALGVSNACLWMLLYSA